jgi:hypothetical protein
MQNKIKSPAGVASGVFKGARISDEARSICIGRLHYGWIIDRGAGRWEAIKADHVSLGLYNDHGAATTALLTIGGAA